MLFLLALAAAVVALFSSSLSAALFEFMIAQRLDEIFIVSAYPAAGTLLGLLAFGAAGLGAVTAIGVYFFSLIAMVQKSFAPEGRYYR